MTFLPPAARCLKVDFLVLFGCRRPDRAAAADFSISRDFRVRDRSSGFSVNTRVSRLNQILEACNNKQAKRGGSGGFPSLSALDPYRLTTCSL